jgi:hypothetical protein
LNPHGAEESVETLGVDGDGSAQANFVVSLGGA